MVKFGVQQRLGIRALPQLSTMPPRGQSEGTIDHNVHFWEPFPGSSIWCKATSSVENHTIRSFQDRRNMQF